MPKPTKIETEDLEAPNKSLQFLEFYHESARKLVKIQQGLKSKSILLGITSTCFFCYSLYYYLG